MITVKDGSYAILIMEDTDIDSDCARTQLCKTEGIIGI